MGILTFESFLAQVNKELRRLKKPAGPARRRGVEAHLNDHFARLKTWLRDAMKHASEYGEKDTLEALEDYLIDLMSILYAAGSPHEAWRRWSALVAFAQVLANRHQSAAVYAALGGEWTAIEGMLSRSAKSPGFEEQIIWFTLGKTRSLPSDDPDNDEVHAWLRLAQSIPKSDHRETEAALQTIADFWLSELGKTWDHYEPGNYPTFHTRACAAAAIARHGGYEPAALSRRQARFLEPGLATPEPPPLVPSVWSLGPS